MSGDAHGTAWPESQFMQSPAELVRLVPWAFFALVEIVLAAVLLSTSVVVGHELRDWRTWYADARHQWAPTPRPSATAGSAAQIRFGLP